MTLWVIVNMRVRSLLPVSDVKASIHTKERGVTLPKFSLGGFRLIESHQLIVFSIEAKFECFSAESLVWSVSTILISPNNWCESTINPSILGIYNKYGIRDITSSVEPLFPVISSLSSTTSSTILIIRIRLPVNELTLFESQPLIEVSSQLFGEFLW